MEVLFFLLEQFPEQPHHFPPKRSSVCVSRVTPIRSITVLESGKTVCLWAAFSGQQDATYSRGRSDAR